MYYSATPIKESHIKDLNDEGTHNIEGITESINPTKLNDVVSPIGTNRTPTAVSNIMSPIGINRTPASLNYSLFGTDTPTPNTKGGTNSLSSEQKGVNVSIDPKELTGSLGLKRIMNFVDSKTPAMKGMFEYKIGSEKVFQVGEIGKYSSKIKSICDAIYNRETGIVSSGIILIYSSYIDAGIIPMALALEEMGFIRGGGEKNKSLFKAPPVPTVDSRTMRPRQRDIFMPATYAMITGDMRVSPNNDLEVKLITADDNINGEKIKVVLISQAGSEGIDLKGIRQIHIMEPWYNVNRLEQIIGRGVRNFSHKALPFLQRNVQIYLHGTILQEENNTAVEAADLYIYRVSEIKAVKIGKVTRLLKETAVDCILNHDQTNFTAANFSKSPENANVVQQLSDGQTLQQFKVGDLDNSSGCDFMRCEFDCLPNNERTNLDLDLEKGNMDTYNESYINVNSEKIIHKIKTLMRIQYFYKKYILIQMINTPKPYPIAQIYAALTQVIDDKTQHLVDKYGRTGYLVNIDDYYLFQPAELSNRNLSLYDRKVPLDYKHDSIHFNIKSEAAVKPVIAKANLVLEQKENGMKEEGVKILEKMYRDYRITQEGIVEKDIVVEKGNWYVYCRTVIKKLIDEGISDDETMDEILVEHIVETLMMKEKVDLLNYFFSEQDVTVSSEFVEKIKIYMFSKFISAQGITGIVLFNGSSRVTHLNIFILDTETRTWNLAQPEDKRDLMDAIIERYHKKRLFNKYVGFIGFENNLNKMCFKIKDTTNARSTGFRSDQSGKDKIIAVLNDLISDETQYYEKAKTKENSNELCVRQELMMRQYEREGRDGKTWFLDTETAIISEFEKKEKIVGK